MKKLMLAMLGILTCFAGHAETEPVTPKVRTYYIAADEVDWDYAPGGVNKMMGMKFEGYSKIFTERGPHRIGTVYRKALYREYTDETFSQAQAASRPVGAHWTSRSHPARRSRRHHSRGLQEQRHPPLQHASARCVLRQGLRRRGIRRRNLRGGQGGRCRRARQDPCLHLEGTGASRPRAQRSQLDRVALSLAHQ